jgi:NCS1 family nucleobase:cation symporter-1
MTSSTMRNLAKRLECPVDDDGGYENDRWTNRDLIPIPPDRRTYKIWSFAVSEQACLSPLTAD